MFASMSLVFGMEFFIASCLASMRVNRGSVEFIKAISQVVFLVHACDDSVGWVLPKVMGNGDYHALTAGGLPEKEHEKADAGGVYCGGLVDSSLNGGSIGAALCCPGVCRRGDSSVGCTRG